MPTKVLRRFGRLLPVLLIVSFATMVMVDLAPGDPAYAILGQNATPDQVALVRDELGLNDSLLERWGDWLGALVTGDLGTSVRTQQSVLAAVGERVPVTLEIATLALLMALAVAIPLGIYTAYRADRRVDQWCNVILSFFISMPAFLAAVALAYIFAVRLQVLPVTGWSRIGDGLGENLRGALLPALALALGEVAVFTRLLRADMIATLREDYVLTARAKGMSDRYILFRHALRPSSFSMLTLSGLSLGRLIGGAVIVETVFALPGLGQLLVQSILAKDLIMVQGIVLFVALSYVVLNLLIDMAYERLDPRLRAGRA